MRDWSQVFFYVSTVGLATLTYLQARKSFFTPFKTEAFKLQLKALEEVLRVFENVDRRTLFDRFDYLDCYRSNYVWMCYHFQELFQVRPEGVKDLEEWRNAALERYGCNLGITKKAYGEALGNPFHGRDKPPVLNERQALELWAHYTHDPLYTTFKFEELTATVSRLSRSPLLPSSLRLLLKLVVQTVYSNLRLISGLMESAAQQLVAEMAEGPRSMSKVREVFEKEFVAKIESLDSLQSQVLGYVYDYLEIEKVVPRDELSTVVRKLRVGWLARRLRGRAVVGGKKSV